MINDALNPHQTISTFAGWSGTGWVSSGFFFIYSAILWINISYQKEMGLHLSIKFSTAVLFPLPWEQEIVKQKSLLLTGQKETTSAQGWFCKDSNLGCFVEFYGPCSQACSMFGQFPMHPPFHTIARLLLHCCNHFLNYRRIHSFPLKLSIKRF